MKTPQQARTHAALTALPCDNLDGTDCWIVVDVGVVTLATQVPGEAPTGQVTLTRRDFDRFVRWYTTGVVR